MHIDVQICGCLRSPAGQVMGSHNQDLKMSNMCFSWNESDDFLKGWTGSTQQNIFTKPEFDSANILTEWSFLLLTGRLMRYFRNSFSHVWCLELSMGCIYVINNVADKRPGLAQFSEVLRISPLWWEIYKKTRCEKLASLWAWRTPLNTQSG